MLYAPPPATLSSDPRNVDLKFEIFSLADVRNLPDYCRQVQMSFSTCRVWVYNNRTVNGMFKRMPAKATNQSPFNRPNYLPRTISPIPSAIRSTIILEQCPAVIIQVVHHRASNRIEKQRRM